MRLSKKILVKKLQFLSDKMGKVVGFKEGQWNLDYSQSYGGYIVVEFMKNGGEHHPLLNKRLTADRMGDALDMALQVLDQKEK